MNIINPRAKDNTARMILIPPVQLVVSSFIFISPFLKNIIVNYVINARYNDKVLTLNIEILSAADEICV